MCSAFVWPFRCAKCTEELAPIQRFFNDFPDVRGTGVPYVGAVVSRQRRPNLEKQQYEIKFRGNLGSRGQEWFDGFSLRIENGEVTVLSGLMIDQSTLYGVLSRIRDLNLQLISVNPVPGTGG